MLLFKKGQTDYQTILAVLSQRYGWSCDPGAIDGIDGPDTKSALKSFQSQFNGKIQSDYSGSSELAVDGVMGPQTWGAIFTVMRGLLTRAWDAKHPGAPLPALTYGYNGKGLYPCGESFPVEAAEKDGYISKANRRVELVFYDKNKAPKLLDPPSSSEPIPKEKCQVYDPAVTEKKPIKVEPEVPEPFEDGEIYWDTGTGDYILVKPENSILMDRETKDLEAFKPYIAKLFRDEKAKDEKKAAAEMMAVFAIMKEYVNAENDSEARAILNNLKQKIKEKADELLKAAEKDKPILMSGNKLKDGDIKELLWIRGKRAVRVRSTKMKNHWRTFNKKEVDQQIRSEHRKAKEKAEKSKGPLKEGEIKLFEKTFFKEDGTLTEFAEHINKKLKKDFFKDDNILDASIGAQFLRYSAEAKFGATIDWKENKTIKVGGKAEGSFSLAEAQGSFDINLPDKDGFDLIHVLKRLEHNLINNDCGQIIFLAQLSIKGTAFVGVCVSASAELGLSVIENKKAEGGAQAGVEIFAGAKIGADTTLGIKMKLIDDQNKKHADVNWTTLADVTYGAWAAVGFGATATFKFGYFEKRFRFQAQIGLVFKAGAGQLVKGSIDAENGAKLIWSIATAMNWQHMGTVLVENMHDLYQGLMTECFLMGKSIDNAYQDFIIEMDEILFSTSKAAEKGLGALKNVDDTLDKYIPGYSGFKQYNATFFLLKSTYHALKKINSGKKIMDAAIETVEKAQREHRWQYATWQMKSNLIYDMRYGGSGLGGLSQERKEDAVITVLRSCRHENEFHKIINSLLKPTSGKGRKQIDIDDLLDLSQQDEFNKMKIKYNYF